uniref:Uncharacterized protein MANES_01G077800 n=1 Tax=Rhizophora mucronata TaxID=61149 RepID=A0A2P2J8C6_RHIMU
MPHQTPQKRIVGPARTHSMGSLPLDYWSSHVLWPLSISPILRVQPPPLRKLREQGQPQFVAVGLALVVA